MALARRVVVPERPRPSRRAEHFPRCDLTRHHPASAADCIPKATDAEKVRRRIKRLRDEPVDAALKKP
jgi:hypothetical protein